MYSRVKWDAMNPIHANSVDAEHGQQAGLKSKGVAPLETLMYLFPHRPDWVRQDMSAVGSLYL